MQNFNRLGPLVERIDHVAETNYQHFVLEDAAGWVELLSLKLGNATLLWKKGIENNGTVVDEWKFINEKDSERLKLAEWPWYISTMSGKEIADMVYSFPGEIHQDMEAVEEKSVVALYCLEKYGEDAGRHFAAVLQKLRSQDGVLVEEGLEDE